MFGGHLDHRNNWKVTKHCKSVIKGEELKTRPPEILKCSKSKTCRAFQLYTFWIQSISKFQAAWFLLLHCIYNETGQAPLITDPPPISFTTLSKKKKKKKKYRHMPHAPIPRLQSFFFYTSYNTTDLQLVVFVCLRLLLKKT